MILGLFFPVLDPLIGSGFGLYEQGTQARGGLGATTARAEDPASLFHNPAGLAQLRSTQLSLDLGGVFSQSFYSNPGQSTWDSDTGFDGLPSFFANLSWKRWAFGVGSTTTFLHDLDWGEADFPARSLGFDSSFKVHEHMLGLAYRLTERFSIGGTYRLAEIDSSRGRIITRPLGATDRAQHYEVRESFNSSGDDQGFILGLHYQRPRRFSAGLTYWSAIDANLDGNRTFALFSRVNDIRAVNAFNENFRDAPLSSTVKLPERFAIGYASRLTVRTRLEGDVSLARWSTFQSSVYNTRSHLDQPEQVVFPLAWEDSLSIRIAGDFQQRKALLWRAAIGHVDGVAPDQTVNSYFPDHDRFMYSFGFSYTMRKKYVFELAWTLVQNRDRAVRDQEFNYDPNAPDFVISNGQEGLYETQRGSLNLGFRIKFNDFSQDN